MIRDRAFSAVMKAGCMSVTIRKNYHALRRLTAC